MVTRRHVLGAAGIIATSLSGCLSGGGGSSGASFPEDGNDVQLVIPYGPGGGFDRYARGVAPYLEDQLDADLNVVPENVEGGGGVRATNQVYASAPDGYTIELFHGNNFSLNEVLTDVDYNVRDFEFVGQIAFNIQVLMSGPEGESSWDAMLESAQESGEMRIADSGTGSPGHMAYSVMTGEMDDVEPIFTHYGGIAEALTALERGEAEYATAAYSSALPFMGDDSELEFIVGLHDEALPDDSIPLAPDEGVPNWQEAGNLSNTIRSFVLPPETDESVRSTWEEALLSVLEDEEFLSWAEENELPIHPLNGAEVRERTISVLETMESERELLEELVDL